MTRARKRMPRNQGQLVVFSKAYAQTWMGEHVFVVRVLPLTLDKVWLRPCVYCKSSHKSMELSLTWNRGMPPHKRQALGDTWPLGSSPLSSENLSTLCE